MLSPEEKRSLQSSEGLAPVVYVQSSCDCPSRRDDLVKALARHIRVDSYGACLNNRTMPSRIKKNRVMSERENLLTLLGKYKFVLALENAECEDYITEKLWNALEVRKLTSFSFFCDCCSNSLACCSCSCHSSCCCCYIFFSCCCFAAATALLLLQVVLQLFLLLLQQLQLLLLLQMLQLKLSGAIAATLFAVVGWYCCCYSTALSVTATASFAVAAVAAGDLPIATATAYPSVCAAFPPPSTIVFATATVIFFDVATFSLSIVFQVGSVPVYHGAPNVADYLPTPSSAVLASSFPSARSLADRLLQLDGDDLAYKRLLAHKRKYASADGRPISNKRLSESVAKRRWGVAEKDQMRLGSHVERFECLVCQRMREREAVRRAGFKEEEPWQAREEHYGCPYPKGPPWGEEKTKGTNQWQRMYAEGFARAVFLAARLGAGEKVLRGEVDKFLLRKEVALVVEGVIRREGDKEALKVYEKELRDLMGKQA